MINPNEYKWTSEVEEILEKLRINCVNLSEYHRKRYYHFKGYGKYFRIPLILLASINSTASVGLQPVLEQQYISGITCLIGMMMGVLGAIELYLGKRKMLTDMLTDIPEQFVDETPKGSDCEIDKPPPQLELPLYHQPRQSISIPIIQPPIERPDNTDNP